MNYLQMIVCFTLLRNAVQPLILILSHRNCHAWSCTKTNTYQIPSKYIISAKIEPLKFLTYLLNISFSTPLQLMKINSTESYIFFLSRTYRARIQLSLTNTRGIQYSPYISHCVSPYRVPNLTLGTKHKNTNEH